MARTRGANNITRRQLPKRVPPLIVSRAFGQKSPLIDADLQAFLARCLSPDQWQAYTDEEREKILECVPRSRKPNHDTLKAAASERSNSDQPSHSGHPLSSDVTLQQKNYMNAILNDPLDSPNIGTDTYVKRAIARFQRDLGDGYYEKAWQDKARRAHQERMDGKFDDYVKQHAEEMFEDDGSLDDNNDEEQDELAQFSEDGEYLDTSRTGTRGRGRPRKSK